MKISVEEICRIVKNSAHSPLKTIKEIGLLIKQKYLWNIYFAAIRPPKRKGWVPGGLPAFERIKAGLINAGIDVVDYSIDIKKYQKFIEDANYSSYEDYFSKPGSAAFIEKSLEHYISADMLSLNSSDIYIDIASLSSPVHSVYKKMYGCQTYRQDLCFPKGLQNTTIGGDAGAMPIPGEFASKMGMHCSLEHFEGDSDTRFIIEAQRVLKKQGKLCIIPLYLAEKYSIQTDPASLPFGGIPFEKDAIIYCTPGFRNRHGRHYDVSHLFTRLVNHITQGKITVYYINNEKEVSENCYMKFALLFDKS